MPGVNIAALILAAGAGTRMGGPKALLDWKGEPFLFRVLDALAAGGIAARWVVLDSKSPVRDEAMRRVRERGGEPVTFVDNPDAASGMLSSIRAGIRALPPDVTHAALHPVDHPGVTADTIRALVARVVEHPTSIVVPSFENHRGHPGIFPREFFPALLAAPDDQGARAVLRANAPRIQHVVVTDPFVVRDVDTPADLR